MTRLQRGSFLWIGLIMALTSVGAARSQDGIPRPEYPRPDFAREAWLNLNGVWSFQTDPDNIGLTEGWFAPDSDAFSAEIVVPFPWQSPASTIQDEQYRGVAWYRRTFTIPPGWTQRTILKFGAVDYFTTVYVNGQLVGAHEGGYTPFEFDITDHLIASDNIVTVRVDDPADLWEIPHGKQRSLPPNPWEDVSFTTTSGIWQTVWLESRPAIYVQSAHITPDVAHQQAIFNIAANTTGDILARITAPDGAVSEHRLSAGTQAVPIPSPILWDIRQPNLYTVDLTVAESGDRVQTYFGMRTIARAGHQVMLNGRPIYTMSVLDQGYWPEGIFTPPTDAAMRWDVEYALSLGFNMIRKHIKIEDPRFYYWADQLGLLIWSDMPSPVAFTDLARTRLMHDTERTIARDYNHPSIVVWTPYNESWGLEFRSDAAVQEWMVTVYNQIKAWDPTRLVVDNSGWRHVMTDIADSHKYTDDPTEWRGTLALLAHDPMNLQVLGHPFFALRHRYDGEPLMMTEYGVGWGSQRVDEFKWQTDAIRREANIVGYTYTELYDIEHELAGFATYTRRPKPIDYDPAIINSDDFIGIDIFQLDLSVTPGAVLDLPVFTSLYGAETFDSGIVRWRAEQDGAVIAEGATDAQSVAAFTTTRLAPLTFIAPDNPGRIRLWVELYSENARRAQNFIDLTILSNP